MKLVDLKKQGFMTSRKILVRKDVADALKRAKEFLPKGHNFKIWSGNRTLAEQRELVERYEKYLKKEFPKNWYNLLVRYTGGREGLKVKKFSSMNHLSGGAVDLVIVKRRKKIPMGNFDLSEKDNLNYYEKKKSLNKKEKEMRDNRRLLKKVMRKVGFKSYNPEWWHWGYMK